MPLPRHLVVAFTDGIDNRSAITLERVEEVARGCESVVEIALLQTRSSRPAGLLRPIAEVTGGRIHEDTSPDDLEAKFERIFDEYRRGYVLRYTPQGVPREGWHEITVKVVRPGGNRYTVRARRGYFGSNSQLPTPNSQGIHVRLW